MGLRSGRTRLTPHPTLSRFHPVDRFEDHTREQSAFIHNIIVVVSISVYISVSVYISISISVYIFVIVVMVVMERTIETLVTETFMGLMEQCRERALKPSLEIREYLDSEGHAKVAAEIVKATCSHVQGLIMASDDLGSTEYGLYSYNIRRCFSSYHYLNVFSCPIVTTLWLIVNSLLRPCHSGWSAPAIVAIIRPGSSSSLRYVFASLSHEDPMELRAISSLRIHDDEPRMPLHGYYHLHIVASRHSSQMSSRRSRASTRT